MGRRFRQWIINLLPLVLCFCLFGSGLVDTRQFWQLISIDRLMPNFATVFDPTIASHPFGKPIDGPLLWEELGTFQEQRDQLGANIRMATFATTLPDPLPGEDFNFAHAADLLAGTVVQPGQTFSMNGTLGPYSTARGYQEGPIYIGTQIARGVGGGVCKMATTLYNVAVLADLPITSRRNHSMQVPYANPGQDATVSEGKIDLAFKNDTDKPILIWADTKGFTLYLAIYGQRMPPQVTWHHEILHIEERPTIRRPNSSLAQGEEKVIIAGAEGITVESWIDLVYPGGETKTRNLGTDWYRPMARLIEYGPTR